MTRKKLKILKLFLMRHTWLVLAMQMAEFQEKTMENFEKLEQVAVAGIPKDDLDKFFEVIFQMRKNVEGFDE